MELLDKDSIFQALIILSGDEKISLDLCSTALM